MPLRPVVVTGLGIICAAGRNPSEFWQRLMSGPTAVTPVGGAAFAAFPLPYAGQVPDAWIDEQIDDPEPDRTARLALVAARQALADGGVEIGSVPPERFGIVLGMCQATPASSVSGYRSMHLTIDAVADRLGSQGTRAVISTACAAGGNAVGLARDKIVTGEADLVLAGGVDALLVATYAGFAGLQALSAGPCAPYSRSDGLNLGEGAAFLLVEALDSALRRGARPLAEVAGYGLSADAHHATAPDPTGRGAATAVRRALADAALTPADVSYVNGHGTGTPANDAMEKKVMRAVFGERAASVPTSSLKSAVGHTLGAAGAVEAVASVLALRYDVAPPTMGFDVEAAGPTDLDFVPNIPRPMPIDVVVSNNYAFGGNNVALVLTKPGGDRAYDALPERDVVVSGIGLVGGLGVGVDAWADALRLGQSAIGEITAFDASGYACRYGAQAPALDGRSFAPHALWRHMNGLSRLSIAASRLAMEDARLRLPHKELAEVGLVFATAAGSVQSAADFDRSLSVDPSRPTVHDFSNVVLNATGGAVCQTLGIRGPTTTICHGAASASIALGCAVETIRAGKADVMVLLAADEFAEWTLAYRCAIGGLSATGAVRPYDRARDGTVPGAAAVALVVESAAHCQARGGLPYARLVAGHHVGAAAGRDEHDLARRSLAGVRARTSGERIDLVVGAADGGQRDTAEAAALATLPGTPVTAPIGLTGDCQAASGAVNIAVAALAIRDGVVPATVGLVDPEVDGLDRYVTESNHPKHPATVLALTATAGSVRGGVLLAGAR